ncbi:prolyl-tRNA synthetase associated domain-containing protein [Limosilactobacillus avium]|uniref:prolyl-tRNA synthetase associated domain-containing protein n=1 Tax=Limosilactobacillus avium TaxID=2991831 RepID=UPI0024BBAB09|nr:prolyl-tRNA synthetase associated domain-containing protein [Limosilactobacillus avium]
MSTFENAFGAASSSRKLAPWPIPCHATAQRQAKNGYVQVKYTWVVAGWHYEARWHSRVPTAQIITYPSWQLDRIHPGKGYGKDAAPRRAQTLVGDHWLATSRVRYLIQQAANNPTPAAQSFVRAVHLPAVVTYFPGNNQEVPAMTNQILILLKERQIPYQLINHPPVYTAAEADQYVNGYTFARAKNLFLHSRQGFFLIMLPDSQRLNMRQLKKQLDTSRLSFARPDELKKILAIAPGAVSPFNLINDRDHQVTLVVARQLLESNLPLGCHPNDNTKTVIIPVDRLLNLVKEWGNPVQILDL